MLKSFRIENPGASSGSHDIQHIWDWVAHRKNMAALGHTKYTKCQSVCCRLRIYRKSSVFSSILKAVPLEIANQMYDENKLSNSFGKSHWTRIQFAREANKSCNRTCSGMLTIDIAFPTRPLIFTSRHKRHFLTWEIGHSSASSLGGFALVRFYRWNYEAGFSAAIFEIPRVDPNNPRSPLGAEFVPDF